MNCDWNNIGISMLLILCIVTLICGQEELGPVRLGDIVLRRPCQYEDEVCEKLGACPLRSLAFYKINSQLSRRKLLETVSCGMKKGSLHVCCPKRQVADERTIINGHTNLAEIKDDSCGRRQFQPRKGTSRNTPHIGEFPWLAILRYKEPQAEVLSMKCGGSLIRNNCVLTAAHCLKSPKGVDLPLRKVRLGQSGSEGRTAVFTKEGLTLNINPMEIEVRLSYPHEEYNSVTRVNDIGLVFLKDAVDYNDIIRPTCLPMPDTSLYAIEWKPGDPLMVAGWNLQERSPQSIKFREMKTSYVSPLDCKNGLLEWEHVIGPNMVCAKAENRNVCSGDSGGPLMLKTTNAVVYQVGLASYGFEYCDHNPIVIYTKVQPYLRWILDNIKN